MPNRSSTPPSKPASQRALDWANFFLSDVETGAGPFMAGYFSAVRHWNPEQIGFVLAAQKVTSVLAQAPLGWLIDRSERKTIWLAAATGAISFGSLLVVWLPGMRGQMMNQAAVGVATAAATLLIAAISLGLLGRGALAKRMGRNGAFSHAGNMITATVAGLLAYRAGQHWIFYLSGFLGFAGAATALFIRPRDIDNKVARGSHSDDAASSPGEPTAAGSFTGLLRNRAVITFALAVILFHFANSPMLPLASQEVSRLAGKASALYITACIVLPQLVMIAVAPLSGKLADTWGRKPVWLVAFCSLALRGALFAGLHNASAIVAIETLDGIGTGIAGVVTVLVVSDLAKGSGHFNSLGGVLQGCLGIGAFLGNLLAGMATKRWGFPPVFLALSALAVAGLILFFLAVPETRDGKPALQQ